VSRPCGAEAKREKYGDPGGRSSRGRVRRSICGGCSRATASTSQGEGVRRVTLIAIVCAVFAQAASADPLNAKNSNVFTTNCGTTQLAVVVNGNGEFTLTAANGSGTIGTGSATFGGVVVCSESSSSWHLSVAGAGDGGRTGCGRRPHDQSRAVRRQP
jgi:hypothetical protein